MQVIMQTINLLVLWNTDWVLGPIQVVDLVKISTILGYYVIIYTPSSIRSRIVLVNPSDAKLICICATSVLPVSINGICTHLCMLATLTVRHESVIEFLSMSQVIFSKIDTALQCTYVQEVIVTSIFDSEGKETRVDCTLCQTNLKHPLWLHLGKFLLGKSISLFCKYSILYTTCLKTLAVRFLWSLKERRLHSQCFSPKVVFDACGSHLVIYVWIPDKCLWFYT